MTPRLCAKLVLFETGCLCPGQGKGCKELVGVAWEVQSLAHNVLQKCRLLSLIVGIYQACAVTRHLVKHFIFIISCDIQSESTGPCCRAPGPGTR